MGYIKEFYRFLKHIYENKSLLILLIENDFKKNYLGSYLGLIWAFLQPLMFITVIWFVFEIGLRSNSGDSETPFFLYLICAMIPWLFFSNSLSSGTNAIVGNSFLVKKVDFRISVLPIVPLGSTLMIHFCLMFFLIIALLLYDYSISIHWIQVFYYVFASVILLLGTTWLTSALRVFIKDITNAIAVLLQMGFWFTPIFWSIHDVPEKYQFLIKLNPVCYITNGYREAFLYKKWFWQSPNDMLIYWITCLTMFVLGTIVFKRLRVHFGDVI